METNITFSGNNLSAVDEGVSTTTGSVTLEVAVSIKKVTKRKAKSTIGVISNEGLPLPVFTSAISYLF
jgi:hypothetical protein